MKNPYRGGKVHPSPPPPLITDHYLSLLPATILTLAAALSPEDKQVLAYLISCCGSTVSTGSGSKHLRATRKSSIGHDDRGGGGGGEHGPSFGCDCFRCYMSYWVRWDTSPNRQAIHEIIEAYEEELLLSQKKKNKNMVKKKKERGKKVFDDNDNTVGGCNDRRLEEDKNDKEEGLLVEKEKLSDLELMESSQSDNVPAELEKGTVRGIVSFIGEKIWGVWNRD